MSTTISLLIFCTTLTAALADNDRLLLVQAVWRHGDRSPTGTFKSDPYQESHWPQGWGQLTAKGMQEHLWLGQKLAGKYVQDLGFIDEHYKSNEIYVRSTDFNRTLISAISNFIGFYSSKTSTAGVDYPSDPAWPQGYLPIPIHTVDDHTDFLGNPDRECPRVDALTKLWSKDTAVQDAQKQFQPLFANLTKLCGEEITWDNIWNVYDSLFVEKRYNLTVSPTLADLYPQIKAASDLDTDWIDGIGLTPLDGIDYKIEMPKIRGGPLLWALIEHMQGKVQCVNDPNKTSKKAPVHRPGQLAASEDFSEYCAWMNPLKYYVYSAHDSTVSALFSALGFKQSNWNETGFPHYSSCVTLELWQKPDKSNYVKVFYWPLDEQQENKRPMEDLTKYVTGCEKSCTLDEFVTRSKPYKMEPSPVKYCANTDVTATKSATTASTQLLLLLSGLIIAMSSTFGII